MTGSLCRGDSCKCTLFDPIYCTVLAAIVTYIYSPGSVSAAREPHQSAAAAEKRRRVVMFGLELFGRLRRDHRDVKRRERERLLHRRHRASPVSRTRNVQRASLQCGRRRRSRRRSRSGRRDERYGLWAREARVALRVDRRGAVCDCKRRERNDRCLLVLLIATE